MYEETKSSIDWKGLFLKIIIAFLVVLIGFKAYSTLKGNNQKTVKTTTETVAKAKTSSTFTANIEKLKKAGESYFAKNEDKLPKTEGNTVMVTLNELVKSGDIEALSDENGKTCDGESSYVTAMLEGEKTKIKANLVCGNASSYSLVYMGENDSAIEDTKVSKSGSKSVTNNYSTSSTKSTTSNTSNAASCNNCGTPSVNVSTNTNVSQNVSINSGSANTAKKASKTYSNNRYKNYTTRTYTVRFDSNGGNKTYASQRVNENETAYNPGNTNKSGYTFIGWYLNGYKYNFSTPVTSDITLVAKYQSNYYYDDYDDDDYYYDDDYRYGRTLRTNTYTTDVYTMGWDTYGSQYISINHTLRLPEYLRNRNIVKAKISNISYSKALNTNASFVTYRNNHSNTFIYTRNGWEADVTSPNTLATINSYSVSFSYDTSYKTLSEALSEGYDVNWTTNSVSKQCSQTFSVNGETNKCNYGIVYKVTWTYQYYN